MPSIPVLVELIGGSKAVVGIDTSHSIAQAAEQLALALGKSLVEDDGKPKAWKLYAPNAGGGMGPIGPELPVKQVADTVQKAVDAGKSLGFGGPGSHEGTLFAFRVRLFVPQPRPPAAPVTEPQPIKDEEAVDLTKMDEAEELETVRHRAVPPSRPRPPGAGPGAKKKRRRPPGAPGAPAGGAAAGGATGGGGAAGSGSVGATREAPVQPAPPAPAVDPRPTPRPRTSPPRPPEPRRSNSVADVPAEAAATPAAVTSAGAGAAAPAAAPKAPDGASADTTHDVVVAQALQFRMPEKGDVALTESVARRLDFVPEPPPAAHPDNGAGGPHAGPLAGAVPAAPAEQPSQRPPTPPRGAPPVPLEPAEPADSGPAAALAATPSPAPAGARQTVPPGPRQSAPARAKHSAPGTAPAGARQTGIPGAARQAGIPSGARQTGVPGGARHTKPPAEARKTGGGGRPGRAEPGRGGVLGLVAAVGVLLLVVAAFVFVVMKRGGDDGDSGTKGSRGASAAGAGATAPPGSGGGPGGGGAPGGTAGGGSATAPPAGGAAPAGLGRLADRIALEPFPHAEPGKSSEAVAAAVARFSATGAQRPQDLATAEALATAQGVTRELESLCKKGSRFDACEAWSRTAFATYMACRLGGCAKEEVQLYFLQSLDGSDLALKNLRGLASPEARDAAIKRVALQAVRLAGQSMGLLEKKSADLAELARKTCEAPALKESEDCKDARASSP